MVQPPPVKIDIAGFPIALAVPQADISRRLTRRYGAFLAAAGTHPLVTINLEIVPDALFIPPRPGPWIIESEIGPEHLTYRSYLEQGELNLVSGQGWLQMAPQAHVENFLRVIVSWLALQHDSLLLHAAGVARGGLGYVFFGPSGAGKTTTSRLATASADVLSDDLVVLRRHAGGYRLYGVPFRGELSSAPRANQNVPLVGLYRLRQDRAHFRTPLRPAVAAAELAAAAPFVVGQTRLSHRLLEVCADIARTVAVYDLHFRRDDGFWQVIDVHSAQVPQTASSDGRPGH